MLAAAGWRGTPEAGGALHDPCCGSGTIAIEAAQIACGIAPGLKRRFAFERLLPFSDADSRADWQRLKSHAQARIHAVGRADLRQRRVLPHGRLRAPQCRSAPGSQDAIQFNGGDALERPAPDAARGPARHPDDEPALRRTHRGRRQGRARRGRPTGDGDNRALPDDFFARLASHWKQAYTRHPAGWTAYVLSPDMKLPSAMRLKESRRVPMWNGPIECRLFRFDLVAGTMRAGPR